MKDVIKAARLDAYNGFKIADGWYGSIGGYYNVSHGGRDRRASNMAIGELIGMFDFERYLREAAP